MKKRFEAERREAVILERLLTMNYQRLPAVLVPMPIIAAVMSWPLLSDVPLLTGAIWLGELLLLALLGLGIRSAYARRNRSRSLRPWVILRLSTSLLNGLGWGLYPALFLWVDGRFDLQLYVAVVVCLTNIGALAASGVFFPSYAIYLFASTLPLVVRMGLEGGVLPMAATFELLILEVVLTIGGLAAARSAKHQQELMFANEQLVKELRRKEEQLIGANRKLNASMDERTKQLAIALEDKHKSELQLARAQKMDAIGRLAGGVAHDFNNVLTAIMGSASFLNDSLKNGSREQREEVEEIVKGADRAARLTAQLLSLARGGFGEPKRMDASRRLQQLTHLLRRAVGEAFHLEVMTAEGPNVVFMDPTQFDQLVMNLVLNARDASASGQSILVTLERFFHGPLGSGHDEGEARLVLRVTDQGSGIAGEVLDQIFEPFFTTKGERGTGLGLPTCFGIVQRAGGSIDVESKPGRGSTFRVMLPLVEDDPISETSRSLVAATRFGLKDVLLVEDQEPVLRIVARSLSNLGARVHEARSAEDALELFRRGLPPLDLVLSDVLLPKQTGPEMVRELRQLGFDGPCLLMSGYVDDAVLEDRITGARLPLLQKPFTSTELAEAIARLLRGKAIHGARAEG